MYEYISEQFIWPLRVNMRDVWLDAMPSEVMMLVSTELWTPIGDVLGVIGGSEDTRGAIYQTCEEDLL